MRRCGVWWIGVLAGVLLLCTAACSSGVGAGAGVDSVPVAGAINTPDEAEHAFFTMVTTVKSLSDAAERAHAKKALTDLQILKVRGQVKVFKRYANAAYVAIRVWSDVGSRKEFDAAYEAARVAAYSVERSAR